MPLTRGVLKTPPSLRSSSRCKIAGTSDPAEVYPGSVRVHVHVASITHRKLTLSLWSVCALSPPTPSARRLVFPGIAGIIGDVWCSGATMGIAPFAQTVNLFQVSGGAESPALSDKSVFPNFFRTVPSAAIEGMFFADLMAVAGPKSVGVIVDWTSESNKLRAQSGADAFVNAVAAKDGLTLGFQATVANIGTPVEEISRAVQTLLSSGVRVVYAAVATTMLLQQLACVAHKQLAQNMGPNHNGVVWMTAYYLLVDDPTDVDLIEIGCTRDEWGAASRGFIGMKAVVIDDGTVPPEPGGKLPAAWYAEYKKRALTYTTTPPDADRPMEAFDSPYAETTYDVVRRREERSA